jgi:hypothetical protein
MKTYHEETLAALFDGEAADPEALADALAQPDSAAFLVGLSRLRVLTQDDDRRPDDRLYADMSRVLTPRRWRRLLASAVLLPAAAAAALLVVAGALTGWFGSAQPVRSPPPPPAASLTRGTETGGVSNGSGLRPGSRPPAARRVMRFEDGRDWRHGL